MDTSEEKMLAIDFIGIPSEDILVFEDMAHVIGAGNGCGCGCGGL